MNESNWVKELKKAYLSEISNTPIEWPHDHDMKENGNEDNFSFYLNSVKKKLSSLFPKGEQHIDSFMDKHIFPQFTDLHRARINGASRSELDAFSDHTVKNHKNLFFQHIISQSSDEPEVESADEPKEVNPDEDRDESDWGDTKP